MQNAKSVQEVIDLSKEKWRWMSECNIDALKALFHEQSVFVHMGGSWDKERELDIIQSGGIHYKKAAIHEVSVNIIGTTAILLNRITLLAVVGAIFFFQMIGLVVAPALLRLVQSNASDLESGLKMVFLIGAVAMTVALLMILTIPEISMDAELPEKNEPAMAAISVEASIS